MASDTESKYSIQEQNMAEYTNTPSIRSGEGRVIAFFKNRNDAYSAITKLKQAGFDSSQIGLMGGEYRGGTMPDPEEMRERESMWEKLKNFFTGQSHDDIDYRDSASAMNWDQNRADYYYHGITEGGALVSVSGPRSQELGRFFRPLAET